MTYDYIIVGAGSAGCVLADRLSADGRADVLLLEAGGENRSPLISMPRGMAKIWGDPRYYWSFPISRQTDRSPDTTWHYGRGLGGSSSVNGTWYYRGHPEDFNEWAERGNPGWEWTEIERCYGLMEDYQEIGAHPSRGVGGPLQVTQLRSDTELVRAVMDAGTELGLPILSDVNSPGQNGVGATQMTVDRRGRRVSAATAFLDAARRRPNLTISSGTTVEKIMLDGRRATGVRCKTPDGPIDFRTEGEVILCAGVIQSPTLLQISGVGPASLLSRLGVDLVCDGPAVGKGLADHLMMSVSYELLRERGHNEQFRGWRLWQNTLRYFLFGDGLMASLLPEVSVMCGTDGPGNRPDVQLGISPFSMAKSADGPSEPGRGRTGRKPGITAVGFMLRPTSRGSVEITSSSSHEKPKIVANTLESNADQLSLVNLASTIRGYMRQPSLSSYVGKAMDLPDDVTTHDDILTCVTPLVSPGLHGTGTCAMGTSGAAVVDQRLRVHGVSGLRVVDCSVMPTPVSGNTNGPAMCLAWRAAEMIIADRTRIGGGIALDASAGRGR